MMAEHPDVAARLRQEVLDTVGPTDRPSYEHIKEMKFMRAFLNGLSIHFWPFQQFLTTTLEVLRLYPPV